MNKVGYAHLTSSTLAEQAKKFKGPLLLGGPDIQCGRYRFAPGSCSDGNYFFHYVGHGKYTRSTWIEEPAALKKRLEALPPGASFPSPQLIDRRGSAAPPPGVSGWSGVGRSLDLAAPGAVGPLPEHEGGDPPARERAASDGGG